MSMRREEKRRKKRALSVKSNFPHKNYSIHVLICTVCVLTRCLSNAQLRKGQWEKEIGINNERQREYSKCEGKTSKIKWTIHFCFVFGSIMERERGQSSGQKLKWPNATPAINTIPSSFAVHNQCKLISIFFQHLCFCVRLAGLPNSFSHFFCVCFFHALFFKKNEIHLYYYWMVAGAFNSWSSCLEFCGVEPNIYSMSAYKSWQTHHQQACLNGWKAKMTWKTPHSIIFNVHNKMVHRNFTILSDVTSKIGSQKHNFQRNNQGPYAKGEQPNNEQSE